MATIGLHIIAKDEKDKILSIITKYSKYFDEICIAVDSKALFKRLNQTQLKKIKVFFYSHLNEDGLLDFAHKRNFLFEKAKTDYIFRLDTDDDIENPQDITELVKYADEHEISVITCLYDYSKDQWGNSNAVHYRETIIKNTPALFWNKAIHECILPRTAVGFSVITDDKIRIIHNIDKTHSIKSAERNIRYLVKEFNKDKEKTDPRTLAYLGRTLFGLGHLDKAVPFLEMHIKKSGWIDDRYLSWCQLGDIYKLADNYKQAIACAFEALQERPDFPDAYFLLHDIYFNMDKWNKALEWGVEGMRKPFPKTNMFIDPSAYTWRPMLSMAECYFQIGEFEIALKTFLRAKKYVPTLDYVKDTEKIYQEAVEHMRFVDKFTWLLAFVKDKDRTLVEGLVNSIPRELWKHEILAKIRHEHLPPKKWNKNEITIFCGGSTEDWSPRSVKRGVGGSEEAVIHISKELTKEGYDVTVYNSCGQQEGDYDGVKFRNIVDFNLADRFNILISWRANIFPHKIQARQKIVWLHDLPTSIEWTADTILTFDKIIVLSEYHKSLLPDDIPAEKIFVSSNGVNPDDFKANGGVPVRNPHRIIYASSYDRGLEQMLEMWPDIKKEIPDAELHAYYGWDVYDQYVRKGLVAEEGFKDKMLKLFAQEGVFEHGRIGHKELIKEYRKAGVYAYYGTYAGEINCIALTKAIASGCAVITNKRYVLGERSPNAVDDAAFKQALIETLVHGEVFTDFDSKCDFIQANSWKSIARDWKKRLLGPKWNVEVETRLRYIWDRIPEKKEVIDIGANKGHILDAYDRDYITSVDIDEYPVKNFVRAEAEALPFDDKMFDTALLAEILEHVPDPVVVLKEAGRVAETVIITVPFEHEWGTKLKPFNTFEREKKETEMNGKDLATYGNPKAKFHSDNYEHLYHTRYYTPETLEADIRKAGFKDFSVTVLRKDEWAWIGATCRGLEL